MMQMIHYCVIIVYTATDQLPVGNNSEGVLAAAAVVDCTGQEDDLSKCSTKGACPLRDVIQLKCIGKDQTTMLCRLIHN